MIDWWLKGGLLTGQPLVIEFVEMLGGDFHL
jgi:hypothetical protein